MEDTRFNHPDRRRFLMAAPAVAGAVLADGSLFSPPAASAQTAAASGVDPFTLFAAANIQETLQALAGGKPSKTIYHDSNLSIILTAESAAAAREFEWHEQRDHVFRVLDGSTIYEIGGTPKNGRNVRSGEWLAPESEGAKTLALKAGDVLVIPRGTPHRRKTPESVTLMLVSPGQPSA